MRHTTAERNRNAERVKTAERVKNAVLTGCGILGILSLLWLIAAPLLGMSLVVFRTGSMAPAMPQGSLALVQEQPADRLSIGEVVTVQRRQAALPVTHRIVDIGAGSTPAERLLILQGDANATPDADPYPVTAAKRVLVAVPGLGNAIMLLQTPQMLALLTLGATALIVWAFWPARRDPAVHPMRRQPRYRIPRRSIA